MNTVTTPQQASPEHRSVSRRTAGVSQSQRKYSEVKHLRTTRVTEKCFFFMQPHHEVHHRHLEHSIAPTPAIDRPALFPKTNLAFQDHW